MKRVNVILVLIALVDFRSTGLYAQSTAVADQAVADQAMADQQTIAYLAKFRLDYRQSMLNKQSESIQTYFADNIRLMPEFQKTVKGKSNALMYHKAFFARFDIRHYERNELEMLDLGAQVVELGQFTMNLIVSNTGKVHLLRGKYLNVWAKQVSGKLVLLTEAWNYNHSVDIADQLRFDEVPAVDVARQAHLPINSNIRFELAALNRLMEVTVTQHDARTWSQFMADDARFIYSNHPIYSGRKALDAFLEKHANELPVFEKLDLRNDQCDPLGRYAIEYASHIANWRSGDSSGVTTGRDLRIWRREPDGSLKIYRQMAMYD